MSSGSRPAEFEGRIIKGGRVLFYPAPNGTVRIVGLSEADEWVAEFVCREADFSETLVQQMERHVAACVGVPLALVR